MAIEWSDPQKPEQHGCSYDHVRASTPIGDIYIEWKSWKGRPSYTCDMPNGGFICEDSLDAAKQKVAQHLLDVSDRLNAMCKS